MTLGLYSYTKDPRLAAIHRSNSEDWVLEIRNTQPEDAGNKTKEEAKGFSVNDREERMHIRH